MATKKKQTIYDTGPAEAIAIYEMLKNNDNLNYISAYKCKGKNAGKICVRYDYKKETDK